MLFGVLKTSAGILAHFPTPKPDNLGHASESSVFNSQPQRKDYMMQFLTEITGQGAAHSIWETSAVPGSSMCLIFNIILTLLAGLFIFPHSFPWNRTFERYPTRKTFLEKFSSERELASSSVLYHSRFWGLSQWPILRDVFKYIGLAQKLNFWANPIDTEKHLEVLFPDLSQTTVSLILPVSSPGQT